MSSAIKQLKEKGFFWSYLGIFSIILAGWLWYHFFPISAWLVAWIFLSMLFVPGYTICRLLTIEFKDDQWGQIIVYFAIGLVYALLFSLIGMILGLPIGSLTNLYVIFSVLVFAAALSKDILQIANRSAVTPILAIKKLFTTDYLLSIMTIAFVIVVLIVVGLNGSLFRGGDPAFHLSILRKVIEGQSLTPENLGFTKSAQIHIAYGFPIWHILIGMVVKLLKSDIFTVYGYLATPLTVLMLLVWYWLLRQIFPSKNSATLAFLLLMVFNFYYTFTVLVLPDSFCQNILLPLNLALALKYVFDQKTDLKLVAILSILLILMVAIHLTQYFYFLLIMFVFGVLFFVLNFKKKDSKSTLLRISLTFMSSLVFLLPFAVLVESKGKVVSNTLKTFLETNTTRTLRYGSFAKFYILNKFAYLVAPFLIIFTKKHLKLIFIIALFMVVPLAYSSPIKFYLMKILGYIFLNRLYGNINWYFVVWALILGFVLVTIDQLIMRLPKLFRYFIDIFLLGFVVWVFNAEIRVQALTNFYRKIFASPVGVWLANNFWFILAAIIGLTILMLVGQKYNQKFNHWLDFTEPKARIINMLLVFLIVFFFFSPRKYLLSDAFKPELLAQKKFNPQSIADMTGGQETIDFIKQNIPSKSIFISNGKGVYLAMLADQHLAAYPHSIDELRYNRIYRENVAIKDKIDDIKKGKIQYILLLKSSHQTVFDQYPQYFQNIYHQQSSIYKVIAAGEH